MAFLTQLTFIITSLLFFNLRPLISLFPLLTASPHIQIDFTADQLTGTRFYFLFTIFIFRSLLRRIGLSKPSHTSSDVKLTMNWKVTPTDIALYLSSSRLDLPEKTTSKSILEKLGESEYHLSLFLSATTVPALLLLLAKRGSGIDSLGSVNVRNRFILEDHAGAIDIIKSQWEGKSPGKIVAYLGETRKVKRGFEIDIITELRNDRQAVVWKQVFTMLQWHRHSSTDGIATSQSAEMSGENAVGEVKIGQLDTLKWAELSKDYNPIHTNDTVARWFGLKGRIAHGNYVVARALAAIPEAETEAQGRSEKTARSWSWMEVEFRRPVHLPANLKVFAADREVSSDRKGDGRGYLVKEGDKTNVVIRTGYDSEERS